MNLLFLGGDPDPTPIVSTTRNAFLWPFTSASAWNIPIANSATFADNSQIRLGSAGINSAAWSDHIVQAKSTDPLVTVSGYGNSVTVRAPVGLTGTSGSDADVTIIEPNGHTLWDFYRFDRVNDTHATTTYYVRNGMNDCVSGTGWGNPDTGQSAGIAAAACCFSAGMMRTWELNTPGADRIKHALQMAIFDTQLKQASSQAGTYQWPAITSDGGWKAYSGTIKIGTLLAIPPGIDITTLGLPNNDSLALAWTLQNFGAYVINRGGASPGSAIVYAEFGAPGGIVSNMRAGWPKIRNQLRVVTNNTRSTIGGKTSSGSYPSKLYPAPDPVAVASDGTKTRDAKIWPFSSDSALNRPIGSGAIYQDYPQARSLGGVINLTNYTISVAIGSASDPLVHITQSDECNQGVAFAALDMRMPVGVTGSPPVTCYRDGFLVGLIGNVANGFMNFRRTSNTTGLASFHSVGSYDDIIAGTGFKPTIGWDGGGHWIAGYSLLHGILRKQHLNEIAAGTRTIINNTLSVSYAKTQLKQRVGTDQGTTYRWPACSSDGDGSGYSGTIPLGALVAIPPGFDIESQSWTSAAKVIARTLQRYGAYVNGQAGSGGMVMYAEFGGNSTIVSQINSNLNAIAGQLRIVENNSPTAIGGGGAYPSDIWPIPDPV